MPEFAYVARDMSGKKLSGTVSAGTEREAAALLGAKSLFPVEIAVARGSKGRVTRRVKGSVMAPFYSQLASLLRSGVPMLRALTVLSQQSTSPTLKAVLTEVKSKVEDGEPLGETMHRYPRVFNDMAVNMVRAGAEGGFLEDALDRVSGFVEQQEDLKGKTAGSLAYPVFILGVGVLVVTVLMVFFVPKFDVLFDTMRRKGTLPMATELLLSMSKIMKSYWWVIAAIIVAGVVGLKQYLQTEKGKRMFDLVKIKTPLLGSVFLNLAVARFCRVLGTLLSNGVPILKSLDISGLASGNRILTESIKAASENITAGERLAEPLASSGHFPPSVVEMISVAEESNSLDTVLVQIADSLERTTFRRLEVVVRLLEPLMLLILAGCVMFIVLALMVPILNSSSSG